MPMLPDATHADQLHTEAADLLRERLAFFAAATHDLKTPLTSLALWMDTVASLNLRFAPGKLVRSITSNQYAVDD